MLQPVEHIDKVVVAARALGLAPYRRLSSGRYTSSRALKLLSVLALSAIYIGGGVSFYMHLPHQQQSSVITRVRHFTVYLTAARNLVFVLALGPRQYPGLLDILNSNAFKSQFRWPSLLLPVLIGVPDWSLHSAKMILMVLGTTQSPSGGTFGPADTALSIATFLGGTVVLAGQNMLLSYTIECLSMLIEDLNSALRALTAEGAASGVELLRALRMRHDALAQLADKFSFAFGPYCIVGSLLMFWTVVHGIFSLITTNDLSLFSVLIGAGVLRAILSSSLVIWQVTRMKNRVEETRSLADEARNANPAGSAQWDELRDWYDEMTQRPIAIRPCGVFEINLSSLCQAAGLAVTYVIVLVQFHQSSH